MNHMNNCQLPCLPGFAEGIVKDDRLPLTKRLKRALAKPWNYMVKKRLKKFTSWAAPKITRKGDANHAQLKNKKTPPITLAEGDAVRVRSRQEIESMLDQWHELKGCAFLEEMWQYCDTNQTVLVSMERFLDERDYKVKKCKGIVLLDGVICRGTPVFGRCDRRCFLFWRVEWLDKLPEAVIPDRGM